MSASRTAFAVTGFMASLFVGLAVAADKPTESVLDAALSKAQSSKKLVFVYAFDSV
jgi:hypothetical protein